MNKQYLRNLQERAQKLLEISSDDQSNEENNISTKAKSRRVDLKQVLSDADINSNHLNGQFEDYRNTDVELLKRCIHLTTQNADLKRQVDVLNTHKSQLQTQKTYLQKQLENFKQQLSKLKQRQFKNNTERQQVARAFQESKKNSLSSQKGLDSKKKNQSLHIYSPIQDSLKQARDDYKHLRKIQETNAKKILELEQRLKISHEKKQNLQQNLLKQRQKSQKLWRFINTQIPQLRDVISSLTNKVDSRVESILLKDINDQQNRAKDKRKNYNQAY